MKPLPVPAAARISRRRLRVSLGVCTAVTALLAGAIPALAAAPGAMAATQPPSYRAPGTPLPSVAGATTPFSTYQAPQGTLGGGASIVSLTSAPTSQYDSPQGEVAGHAYVQLTGTGQYVQWTNNTGQPINFINVRAAIPDASGGGGITGSLDLYVNGVFRQALNMNSMQSWQYEGNNNYNGNDVALTGISGSNLTATNNFTRGTGDDGMAINSVAYNGSQTYTAMSNITMTHNTVIAPWGGKGIGIYGGSGHHVLGNYISDTARYIGLGVGRFGVNGSDMTGATVSGNVIVRSGGNAYNQGQPALHVGNGGDGQGVAYNVTSVNGTANSDRSDGMDIEACTDTG